MGELQERITSTRRGSITSMQAVYVPADDYTDPAPVTTFAHLDATISLERSIADQGIYPAVDPLASTSRILDHASWAKSTMTWRAQFSASPALQGPAGYHRHPGRRRVERRRQAGRSPRAQDAAILLPALLRGREVHRARGRYVPVHETVRGFKMILDGQLDAIPEQAFRMVGSIDEAIEAGRQMQG